MDPQDQGQITFRSETHSCVFSVGQEGDCEERISRSGDFGTIYSVSQKKISSSCNEWMIEGFGTPCTSCSNHKTLIFSFF